MEKFTASEVRTQARLLDGLSRQMLNRFAARLEADEKAVPVYQVKGDYSYEWKDCSKDEFENTSIPFKRRILYAYPAPSDVERLAEALRNLVEASHYADAPDEHEAAEAALATHSAQAQPPAASVTDAHWFRARAWLSDESLGYDRWKADMYSLGKGTHESYILVIGEIPALGKHLKECENPLAAQETPNG